METGIDLDGAGIVSGLEMSCEGVTVGLEDWDIVTVERLYNGVLAEEVYQHWQAMGERVFSWCAWPQGVA